jgi:type II secretory pathway component PulK
MLLPTTPRTSGETAAPPTGGRKGVVLLAVLVIITLLTLAAYEFSELMLAEYRAAESSRRAAQARALADSGVHYAAALLSSSDAFSGTLGSNPYDNTQAFQGILVHDDEQARFRGRFSVVALRDPDDPAASTQAYRFGVSDESGKINLNALMKIDSSGKVAHDMLMTLPNMTEDVANAILDWIDPDDDPRTNGAENDYYSSCNPPYRCKNGPLDSLEELLLVKGVTPPLLFGNDLNRNGVLDPDEDQSAGAVDRGWSAYLTCFSREQNVDSDGNARIYINDPDLEGLYDRLNTALGPDLAAFIIAYRQYGPANQAGGGAGSGGTPTSGGGGAGSSPSSPGGSPTSSPTGSQNRGGTGTPGTSGGGGRSGGAAPARLTRNNLNFRQGRPRSVSSLFELVNASVSVPSGSSSSTTNSVAFSSDGRSVATTVTRTTTSATVVYPSPLNDPGQQQQLLPLLLDKVTTSRDAELPARINVNTASQTVLSALPGIASADVQSILEHRPDPSSPQTPDPIFQSTAWLLTEANLRPATLRSLERYITARTQVYRLQSVGTFDGGGPTARVEAVIDTNGGRPRILYYRDLTELGKGFNLSPP